MDTDEDTDEEQEDAPLVASDEQARREARLRHEPTVWSDDPLSNVTLVLLLLLALGGGILTGFYGFDGLVRFVSHMRCATPDSSARMAAVPARAVAAAVKSADSPVGHEWFGGAVGGSEGAGHDERWGAAQQEPRNGTLLVLGILSGSRNFEERDWLRRGYWKQRAARQGVEWRFVVGKELPSGDNNRVSLLYEQAKYRDIDIVQGSEVSPAQARHPRTTLPPRAARQALKPPLPHPLLHLRATLLTTPHTPLLQALKALGWLLQQADLLARGGRAPLGGRSVATHEGRNTPLAALLAALLGVGRSTEPQGGASAAGSLHGGQVRERPTFPTQAPPPSWGSAPTQYSQQAQSATLAAQLLTALASWGGLSWLLAAPRTRHEPRASLRANGRLQCGPEAAPRSPIPRRPTPRSYSRCRA